MSASDQPKPTPTPSQPDPAVSKRLDRLETLLGRLAERLETLDQPREVGPRLGRPIAAGNPRMGVSAAAPAYDPGLSSRLDRIESALDRLAHREDRSPWADLLAVQMQAQAQQNAALLAQRQDSAQDTISHALQLAKLLGPKETPPEVQVIREVRPLAEAFVKYKIAKEGGAGGDVDFAALLGSLSPEDRAAMGDLSRRILGGGNNAGSVGEQGSGPGPGTEAAASRGDGDD